MKLEGNLLKTKLYQVLRMLDICERNRNLKLKNKYFLKALLLINKLTRKELKNIPIKLILWEEDDHYYDCLEILEILDNTTSISRQHRIPIPVLEEFLEQEEEEITNKFPIELVCDREEMSNNMKLSRILLLSKQYEEIYANISILQKYCNVEVNKRYILWLSGMESSFINLIKRYTKEKENGSKIFVKDCLPEGSFYKLAKEEIKNNTFFALTDAVVLSVCEEIYK